METAETPDLDVTRAAELERRQKVDSAQTLTLRERYVIFSTAVAIAGQIIKWVHNVTAEQRAKTELVFPERVPNICKRTIVFVKLADKFS